jgi:hypothetical protein
MNKPVHEGTTERRTKRVRLLEGVYALGQEHNDYCGLLGPARVVHLADINADLESPTGVTAWCGAHFAPRTLEVVEHEGLAPHNGCRRASQEGLRTFTVSYSENAQAGTPLALRQSGTSPGTSDEKLVEGC